MGQIQIDYVEIFLANGDKVMWKTGDEVGIKMMCLTDGGWLLREDNGGKIFLYPPHRVHFARAVA